MPNYSGSWSLSAQNQARGNSLWPAPPGAPTIGTATASGPTSASVTFTAPSDPGVPSTITSYTVTSNPGGITASGSSSPITVTGLTTDTAYTFTVTATNATGTGASSAASNSVTPVLNYFVAASSDSSYNVVSNSVCVDSSGNTYYAGSDGGYPVVWAINGSDSLLWSIKFTSYTGYLYGIAADSLGNVYAVGMYTTGNEYGLIIKLNSSGEVQWQRRINAPDPAQSCSFSCVAVDSNNDVICGGNFSYSYYGQPMIIKYTSEGVNSWQQYVGYGGYVGASQGSISSIALDSSNNIYVNMYYVYPGVRYQVEIAKLNSTATSFSWRAALYTPDQNGITNGQVAIDSSGNTYATMQGPSADGNYRVFLVKLDTSGSVSWTNQAYLSGGYTGSQGLFVGSDDCPVMTITYDSKAGLLKYNSSGTLLYKNEMSNGTSLSIRKIAKGASNIILGGGSITFSGTIKGFCTKLPYDGSKLGSYSLDATTVTYATNTAITTGSTSLSSGTAQLGATSMSLTTGTPSLSSSTSVITFTKTNM